VSGFPRWRRFSTNAARRLVAAAEAFAAGYGGITAVARATGMAPSTIGRGLKELGEAEPSPRVRRPGAGRKPAILKDPTVSDAEMAALNIKHAEFHGEWNYTISPNTHPPSGALIS
jgi:hypothetical protein